MKRTLMSNFYPIIFKNIIKGQLCNYYTKNEINNILKLVNKEYKRIVKEAPEIGGSKNTFISSYLMGAYLIALYKNVKEKLSLDDMDVIIPNGLNDFKYMKNKMKKVDLLSKEYKEKIKNAGKWCEENKEKYPTNWQVEVKDIENPNLTNVVFTNCGLCTLCKKEGVEEFTKSLCATDYITMSFANCKLERPTTLAKGDSCCDFRIRRL